jgi:hypothetical protein
MPQEVFDGLAIVCGMSTLLGKDDILVKPLKDSRRSYPDEDRGALVHDIYLAAIDVNKAADHCFDVFRRKMGISGNEVRVRFKIMDRLLLELIEQEREKKPLWRLVFRGAWFNYETASLVHRVEKCRQNVSRAADTVSRGLMANIASGVPA